MQNPLKQWLDATATTQVRLSELSGIPQSEISKYANSKRRPDLDNAFRIEDATGGAVPARVWKRVQVEEEDADPALARDVDAA